MKNWEKLKTSLLSRLDAMSEKDWIEWKNKQDEQRKIQFAQKEMEALIHALKTSIAQSTFAEGETLNESVLPSDNLFYVEKVEVNDNISLGNDILFTFSFAA